MPYKTRSKLIEENTILRARLAKLEGQLADQFYASRTLVERGAGEHRHSKKGLQNGRVYPESAQRASSKKRWSSNDQRQANGNTNGKPTRVRNTAQDLCERKQNEDALKASEICYRRLFETARDGIIILDADTGCLIDVNPYLEDMLGCPHEELLGKRLWEIGLFRDIAAGRVAFRRLQNQEYLRCENLSLETEGRQCKQVELVSNVYLVDGKRVMQCNLRDITARKQAEESLRKANDKLLASVTELQRRDSQMKLINRMIDLLQICTTQEEAYQVIDLIAGELFAGQCGCLAVLHTQERYLETVAHWGEETPVESTFALDDCWAMRRGQPHEVINPSAGLLCHHFVQQPGNSYFCVPLVVHGEILGLLCLIVVVPADDGHQVKLRQMAVAVGEAVKQSLSNLRLREKLREQAIHDPLTGLFNRRYLEESLSHELLQARRRSSSLCVAMLDFDHFKRFNDTYGHSAGDALLGEFGQVLREKLRKSDILCRYGGEEFVLVLPDSSLANALQCMEQIRVLVKTLQIRHGEQLLSTMTVSIGIAKAHEHGSTTRELLRAADEAMYAAKQSGRDRVVIYQRD